MIRVAIVTISDSAWRALAKIVRGRR